MIHRLECEQWLPIGLNEAWSFFSSPHELSRITPPEIGFQIHSDVARDMFSGQIIRYTVKPMWGIPLTWITRIEGAEAPHRFVDVQLHGPYKSWRHEHTFQQRNGGVLMTDRVDYEMPLGFVGEWIHALTVKKRIERIFDHRRATLEQLFPAVANNFVIA